MKLKEISYIHAEAYASGELKHGTLALIVEGVPVIALATQKSVYEKTLSNIKEVKEIAKVIDTEVFVQGALCASFSGHCYMSSFIGGNSGNRGYCKQPCRQKYLISDKPDGGEYPISLSDLSLINDLKELEDAGVKSIKIEGRMRSPEYVAATVKSYRAAIDGKEYSSDAMEKTFNRGNYTKGYIFGQDCGIISDKTQSHVGKRVGTILSVHGGEIFLTKKVIFNENDAFKILRDGKEVGNAIVKRGKIQFSGEAKKGDALNITKDTFLVEELLSAESKKVKVEIFAKFVEGERAELSSQGVTVYSDEVLETAKSSPVTIDMIAETLQKTDVYPFEPVLAEAVVGNAFILKSSLNKMRANLFERLFYKNVKHFKNQYNSSDFKMFYNKLSYRNIYFGKEPPKEISSSDAFVFFPENYDDIDLERISSLKSMCKDVFLFVPAFLPESDSEHIEKLLKNFDGVYADGISGLALSDKLGKKVIVGAGLNVFNKADISYLQNRGIFDIVYSVEASERQLEEVEGAVYAYSSGGIRVMELIFCLFGKKCSGCSRGNVSKIKDCTGHDFYLYRYKLSGNCRFEIYNGSALKTPLRNNNFINLAFNEDNVGKTTVGNYKRGIK